MLFIFKATLYTRKTFAKHVFQMSVLEGVVPRRSVSCISAWRLVGAGSSLLRQVQCQFTPVPVRYSQFQFPSLFLRTQQKSERGKIRDFSAIRTPDRRGPRQCVPSHAATSQARLSYQVKTGNPSKKTRHPHFCTFTVPNAQITADPTGRAV